MVLEVIDISEVLATTEFNSEKLELSGDFMDEAEVVLESLVAIEV